MRSVLQASLLIAAVDASEVRAADFEHGVGTPAPAERVISLISGRASALSGDTLWFPTRGMKIRLDGIRACALAQWAFDPSRQPGMDLAPVACGPFAKAWLKRAIGNAAVSCRATSSATEISGRCEARGIDLGFEMLRVGWARTDGAGGSDPHYAAAERYARSARYGLWGTYVLDPGEWQARAVDRTLDRRPAADRNLLGDRHGEITPPFADWRHRPPIDRRPRQLPSLIAVDTVTTPFELGDASEWSYQVLRRNSNRTGK
jgi:endonuclease YncB( thermonuclease family)